MEYGYIRVSTLEQNETRQRDAMRARSIPVENIYLDRQSGKDFARPQYKRRLRLLREFRLVREEKHQVEGRDFLTAIRGGRRTGLPPGLF